jgi:hypothetical protein
MNDDINIHKSILRTSPFHLLRVCDTRALGYLSTACARRVWRLTQLVPRQVLPEYKGDIGQMVQSKVDSPDRCWVRERPSIVPPPG